MSGIKIAILAGYAVLFYLATGMQGNDAAQWASWVILALVLVHIVEAAIFFKKCKEAQGSLPLHLFNVLLFGVFHIKEIQANGQT